MSDRSHKPAGEQAARPAVDLRPRTARLHDGTRIVTRPITPADGPALTRGLQRLSPRGNAYRFLHFRKRFTEEELRFLTHCDFIDHIGLVAARTGFLGFEREEIGVARCIRAPGRRENAEAAIVVVDAWHRRGVGGLLLRHLADLSIQARITRWEAILFEENTAALGLFGRIASEVARRHLGSGTMAVEYELTDSTPGRG